MPLCPYLAVALHSPRLASILEKNYIVAFLSLFDAHIAKSTSLFTLTSYGLEPLEPNRPYTLLRIFNFPCTYMHLRN
jgi:hypothetical protein